MRILVIEGDLQMNGMLKLMLDAEGFTTFTSQFGDEGVDLAKFYEYDAIVLSCNISDMAASEVLRMLRANRNTTPLIYIDSAKNVDQLSRVLSLGADDYIYRPFHKNELVERLRAVVRRSRGQAQNAVTIGKLKLDLGHQTVEYDGKKVNLTSKEFKMLELMALRPDITVTKQMFLDAIYCGMDEPMLKIFDVFICKIRRKLKPYTGDKDYIETVWGRGFRLVDPEIKTVAAEVKAVA